MHDLILSNSANPLANMYAQQAAEMNAASTASGGFTKGIEPAYYDHYNAIVVKGHIEFTKSVKGQREKYSPFTPDDMYSMGDEKGPVNHNFKAFRGIPLGLFLGASLSNYNQPLSEKEYGGHCSTTRLEYHPDAETTLTVYGKQPIQSPGGLAYGLAAYHNPVKDAGKPRKYGNHPFQTYGRASEAYAAEIGRPVVMSCADCISQNFDSFREQKCKVSGTVAFYITHLAYETKGIQWRTVAELAPSLEEGFIAVFKVTSMDLQKKSSLNLAKKENHYIPVTSQNIFGYYQTVTAMGPDYVVFQEVPNVGPLQMLAAPTEAWVADISEVSPVKGSIISYCPDLTYPADLTSRHKLLTKALEAYKSDRNKNDEDAESEGTLLPKKEPIKVVEQVDDDSNVFADLVPF